MQNQKNSGSIPIRTKTRSPASKGKLGVSRRKSRSHPHPNEIKDQKRHCRTELKRFPLHFLQSVD